MYDQACFGEVSDVADLEQYMHSYDRETYIGPENTQQWSEAINAGKTNLFSFGYDHVEVGIVRIYVISHFKMLKII